MKVSPVSIILLAAGSSSRMGDTVKQLLPWGGVTLVEHMKRVALASAAYETIVVLGAHAAAIREELTSIDKCHIIENPNWNQGLSSSIAQGVQYLEERLPASEGALIMLCDQPLLTTAYLDLMIETFSRSDKNIVASNYGTAPGVPALFGRQFFTQLRTGGREGGAQGLLKKMRSDLILLEPGRQVLDMDVAEDYEKLLRAERHRDGSSDAVT